MEFRAPFEWGDHVQDVISKFKGRVTGISVYDTGCMHVCVEPEKCEKDSGKPAACCWVDVGRLKKVPNSKRLKLVDHTKAMAAPGPGGPGKTHSRGD